ncbi:MAG TPA: ergothioneine biosynthesis glutamate--cysteine ligase EgtA [Mycobacteriales bacterium]|nr:ergothioneine biosynthesis glutamate--cysteine ligase EgtA [Mycobacteriales bacterium]
MTVQSFRPISAVPLDLSAVRDQIAGTALQNGTVGRVGLELEAHLVDLTEPARRVPWQRICDLLAALPDLPGRSRVTVEPGGQVELSGVVQDGPAQAIAVLRRDEAALRQELRRRGLGLATLGADPSRPPRRVNPGRRYVAMERHFTDTGQAAAGRAMMCSTAALQVNLDAGPAAGWCDRIALAQRLGPVLVALSACSPLLAGARTGWRSSRQRVWAALDDHRRPEVGARRPEEAWADYALEAPIMMIHNGHHEDYDAIRSRVPMRSWADGTTLLADRRPTKSDVEYHLTTLFPPIRLRGYLEIRCLDAMPDRWWPALAAVTCLLMDDPVAADAAAAAVEPVAGRWQLAAQFGVSDPVVRKAALQCLAAAASVAPAELKSDIERYAEIVAAGRTPADDLLERARIAGPLAVLEEAAHA